MATPENNLPAHSASITTVDKLRMLLDITKTISRSLELEEVLLLTRR